MEITRDAEVTQPVGGAGQKSDDYKIITFDEGILGFEDVKEYHLYQEDDDRVIWNLRAAHGGTPSFIVIDPYSICGDYNPEISEDDARYFGSDNPEDLCVLAVAVIKPELHDSVVNLKAPVIISLVNRKGRQVMLDADYPVRCPLFAEKS